MSVVSKSNKASVASAATQTFPVVNNEKHSWNDAEAMHAIIKDLLTDQCILQGDYEASCQIRNVKRTTVQLEVLYTVYNGCFYLLFNTFKMLSSNLAGNKLYNNPYRSVPCTCICSILTYNFAEKVQKLEALRVTNSTALEMGDVGQATGDI